MEGRKQTSEAMPDPLAIAAFFWFLVSGFWFWSPFWFLISGFWFVEARLERGPRTRASAIAARHDRRVRLARRPRSEEVLPGEAGRAGARRGQREDDGQ